MRDLMLLGAWVCVVVALVLVIWSIMDGREKKDEDD